MARYYWDVQSFRRDLDKLYKMISNEDNPIKRQKLMYCYDIINNSMFTNFLMPEAGIPLHRKIHSLYASFLSDQRYFELLNSFIEVMDDNLELYNQTYNHMDDINDMIAKASGVHVGREQAVSICYDFYKNLDNSLFRAFQPFYNERFNHLRFLNSIKNTGASYTRGQQYYLYGMKTNYVEVIGSDNPDMVMTLIHESAHVIDANYSPESYLYETYYYEVISLFMELVSNYKKAGNFDELFYYSNYVKRISSFCADAEDGLSFDALMGIYKENHYSINDTFYSTAKEKYDLTKKSVKDILSEVILSDIVYPISFSLALYFFNIYKQDEKKGLVELKKFLKTKDRDEYMPFMLSEKAQHVMHDELKSILTECDQFFQQQAILKK